MILSKTCNTPITENNLEDGFGLYQFSLDLIKEEGELFTMFANHDIKEMHCMTEADIAALNEFSIIEMKDKFLKMIANFVEKFKMAISKFVSKMMMKLDMWKKAADKYTKLAESNSWGSSKTVEANYINIENLNSRVKDSNVLSLTEIVSGEKSVFKTMGINTNDASLKGIGTVISKDIMKTTTMGATKQNIEILANVLRLLFGSISTIDKNRSNAVKFQKNTASTINKLATKLGNATGKDPSEISKYMANTNQKIQLYNQYMIGLMSSVAKGGNDTIKSIQEVYKAGLQNT